MEWSGDRLRGGADARGYDARWRKARALVLQRNPLCAECGKAGRLTPATVVDHIIPHRGDKALFWDEKTGSPCVRAAMIRKPGAGCDYYSSASLSSSSE